MSGSIVVITGASSGIGAALAAEFSEAGHIVVLLARNLQKLKEISPKNAHCMAVDVTDFEQFKQAIASIEAEHGAIDCMINNAGVAKAGDFAELDVKYDQNMVNVNILGVLYGCKAVLPGMLQRKSGTIINMSSIADRKSRPTLPTYAATKAAVRSLTESLREAYADQGVRICNVAPAKIRTPMLTKAALLNDDVVEVTDFAKSVLWVYQQPAGVCIRDFVIAPTTYEA